jgi:hypothetical protein
MCPARAGCKDERSRLLDPLADPSMYRGQRSVTVHDTRASWVLVAKDRA